MPLVPRRVKLASRPRPLRLVLLPVLIHRVRELLRLARRQVTRPKEQIQLPLVPRRVRRARTMRRSPWDFWPVETCRRSDLLPLDRVPVNCHKPLDQWQWVLPLVFRRREAVLLPSEIRRATPTSRHRQSLWVCWLDLPFREATRLRLEHLLRIQTRERRPFRLDCKVVSLDRERAQSP